MFFLAGFVVANRVQRETGSVENWLPKRGIVRLLQSLMGGRDHVKFIVISKLYYIDLASFRPWQLTRSYLVGKKISRCYNRGITHSRVTFNSLENLVPAQVSVQRRTESHKKQSNTTQQNGTEMETN